MLRYKMAFKDGVALYGKYVGNWGGEATRWRFDAVQDGNAVSYTHLDVYKRQDEYTCEAMKIFLLGAIKRVFQPGCKFETMLCLAGGQGAGKSTFFRLLAVKDEWFSDDLRRLDDDNVYHKLQGHWIIEMSEMIATANEMCIRDRYTWCGTPGTAQRPSGDSAYCCQCSLPD